MVHCSCFVIGIGVWLLSLCVQVSTRKCYKGEKPSVSFTLGQREEVKSETILSSLPICESTTTRVALMISESTTTQFSSIISVSAASQSRCSIVLPAASQFSLSNCVVRSKSVLVAELCCLQRVSFCCRIVLSVANHFSMLNCVVHRESVFPTELYGLQQTSFRYWIVLSAANQFSLSNCGARSESVSLPNSVVPATNQFSLLNSVSSSSLPKSESLANQFLPLILCNKLPCQKWLKCL